MTTKEESQNKYHLKFNGQSLAKIFLLFATEKVVVKFLEQVKKVAEVEIDCFVLSSKSSA